MISHQAVSDIMDFSIFIIWSEDTEVFIFFV